MNSTKMALMGKPTSSLLENLGGVRHAALIIRITSLPVLPRSYFWHREMPCSQLRRRTGSDWMSSLNLATEGRRILVWQLRLLAREARQSKQSVNFSEEISERPPFLFILSYFLLELILFTFSITIIRILIIRDRLTDGNYFFNVLAIIITNRIFDLFYKVPRQILQLLMNLIPIANLQQVCSKQQKNKWQKVSKQQVKIKSVEFKAKQLFRQYGLIRWQLISNKNGMNQFFKTNIPPFISRLNINFISQLKKQKLLKSSAILSLEQMISISKTIQQPIFADNCAKLRRYVRKI